MNERELRNALKNAKWRPHAKNLSTDVTIYRLVNKSVSDILKVDERVFTSFPDAVRATEPYDNAHRKVILIQSLWNPVRKDMKFMIYSPKKILIERLSSLAEITSERLASYNRMFPAPTQAVVDERIKAFEKAKSARKDRVKEKYEALKRQKIDAMKDEILKDRAAKAALVEIEKRRRKYIAENGIEEGSW